MSSGERIVFVYISLVASFLLFSSIGTASVIHRIEVVEGNARVSSLLKLTSDTPANQWNLTVQLPQNSTVRTIYDPRGNITYSREDEDVKFQTNSGPVRREEKVIVNYTVRDVKTKISGPLNKVQLSLFAFKNQSLKALIRSPSGIISWYTPFKFRSEKVNSSLRFQGKGSLPLITYVSDEGHESEHYHYFRDVNISRVENLYPILPYMTGIKSPHDRYPILFLNESRYNTMVNEWSSGRYRSGGLILVRRNLSTREKVSTAIHETMHGFNEKIMKWDETESTYLDEGMAKFAEFLAKRRLGTPRAEIFGDKTVFERNGNRYYYEPRSSGESLWNYYTEDKEWMERWNPWESSGENYREFGYAYSELLMREYVEGRGIKSLRNLSSRLLKVDRKVESPGEKSKIISEILGGFRPCYSTERDSFEKCLDKINNQKFNLTDLNLNLSFEGEAEKINISGEDFRLHKKREDNGIISGFKSWMETLFGGIRWILRKL